MIEIRNAGFRHENSEQWSIRNVTLSIPDGQCILLCGESGSGKTTLTRLINGLIPHYYEGETEGEVIINGLRVDQAELYETARMVGSVFQNPRSQFFCVDTTSEIAFGCENMGMPEEEIIGRVDEAASEMGIKDLLGRSIFELSGGEKQKIACASVSALHPDVMVLDEPTSNLDIQAIEDLKEILLRWKTTGKTIVIAEHRLYWLRKLCDRVICMKDGGIAFDLPMAEFAAFTDEELHAHGLRAMTQETPASGAADTPEKTLVLENFCFAYEQEDVLAIDHIVLPAGGVIAVTGSNGAGKSTFSRCLCGLEKKFKGTVHVGAEAWRGKRLLKKCYMVMQDVNHQLFCESVEDEVQLGMAEDNAPRVHQMLVQLDLDTLSQRHPMSLSGGQKQRVAIATATLADKEILVFDEPTSGLDFRHMEQTAALLSSLRGQKTVLVVTHDLELIARCCTHVLRLDHGKAAELYALTQEI